jgi:hypothetical protein
MPDSEAGVSRGGVAEGADSIIPERPGRLKEDDDEKE